MSSVPSWKEIAAIPSDRAAFAGRPITAFVVDDLSGEELERISLTPAKDRLGYCSWTKDLAVHINETSSFIRAGVHASGSFTQEASSYTNKIHAAIGGLRAFTTALHQDNWVAAGVIEASRAIVLGEAVSVVVSNEVTGTVYERLVFDPTSERLSAVDWRQDLATWINTHSLYIRAGRAYADKEVDKEKMKTDGQELFYAGTGECKFWVPKGSALKVESRIVPWREINMCKSDRAITMDQKVMAFAVDEITDEELERISFTPTADRTGYCLWIKDFCVKINNTSTYLKAGELLSSGRIVAHPTSWKNRIYTAHEHVRAFSTVLKQENWVDAGAIPASRAMKREEWVVVRVCNEATGKVYETHEFDPGGQRMEAAEWRQDLATYRNKNSDYVRAGRLYASDERDEEKMLEEGHPLFYASTGECRFWVPVGSYLKVHCELASYAEINDIKSDRAAYAGQKVMAFAIDSETDEELERITFTATKDRLGFRDWLMDFATHINATSTYLKAGQRYESGRVKPASSSYLNRLCTVRRNVRGFTTALRQDNWLNAGIINAPKDLKQGDVVIIRVCSEATGKIFETLTFTVGKDQLKASEWRQALASYINKKSVYMRAGRLYTDKEIDPVKMETVNEPLFYPSVAENWFWLPKGSGLYVEVDDWMKVTRVQDPIPYSVEVDPRTGECQASVHMGTLMANKGRGPFLDVVFNVLNRRAEFKFTSIFLKETLSDYVDGQQTSTFEYVLSLSTGEVRKFTRESKYRNDTLVFATFKIAFADGGGRCIITRKDGTVEDMRRIHGITKFKDNTDVNPVYTAHEWLYLPRTVKTALGLGVSVEWQDTAVLGTESEFSEVESGNIYTVLATPKKVVDDDGVVLLDGTYKEKSSTVIIYPDSYSLKTKYVFSFQGRGAVAFTNPLDTTPTYLADARVTKIVASTLESGSSELNFEYSEKRLCRVGSPDGRADTLAYHKDGRVSEHVMQPGLAISPETASYKYAVETDKATKEVTSTTSISRRSGGIPSTESLSFDKSGLLTKRVAVQGDCTTSTTYTARVDAKLGLTTHTTSVVFSKGGKSRSEDVVMSFDLDGNLVKRVEKGVCTEWTYYSGEPTVKREEVKRKRVDAQASVMGLIFGGAVDFINPIGWGMNLFSDRGFTWGTDYTIEVSLLPGKTTIPKATFNLPMDLACPGDPNFLTWLVASERIYTHVGTKRVELHWNFYGYGAIQVKGGDKNHPAVVPTKKLTLRDPVSSDGKKVDSYSAGEVEEIQYFADPAESASYGQIKKTSTWLLDAKGGKVADSDEDATYSYRYLDGMVLETATKTDLGTVKSEDYWLRGNCLTTTDRFLNKTKRCHGVGGRLLKVTSEDEKGAVVSDATHRYEYLFDGHRVETHVPQGAPQRVQYDALGRDIRAQTWISPALGWRTLSSQEYDGLGRVVRVVESDYRLGGRLLSRDARRRTYDHWGQLSEERSEADGGQVLRIAFDPIAQTRTEWVELEGVAGHKSVTSFNAAGAPHKMSLVDSKGTILDEVQQEFTPKWEVSRSTGKYLPETKFEYDAHGRQLVQNVGGVVMKNEYPAHTKKAIATKATVWDGYHFSVGTQVVDKFARVTRRERNGREINYTYKTEDHWQTFVGVENPEPSVEPLRPDTHQQTYDDARLCLSENFNGKAGLLVSSTCRYSLQGRALEVIDPFAGTSYHRYDRSGRFVGASSPVVYSSMALDGQGMLRRECVHDKFSCVVATVECSRDDFGRETERCVSVPGFDDLILRRTFDGAGRLSKSNTLKRKVNVETVLRDESFSYTTEGRLKKYGCNKGEGPILPGGFELMEQSFNHDSGGLNDFTSKVKDTLAGSITIATDYTYRSTTHIGKLSTAELNEMSSAIGVDKVAHDDHGRLCAMNSLHTGGSPVSLSYNKYGSIHGVHYQYGGGTDPGSSGAYPMVSYVYDTSGKLVSWVGERYKQDILYRGDAPYALVRRWNDPELGSRRVALLNDSDSCHVQRTVVVPVKGAESTRHTLEVKDAHGSLVASYDLSAKSARMFSYTPYGYRPADENDTSWIGYNGELLDPHLGGIYHLGNGYRVYDPTIQRFHAPDDESPFGLGGANAYAYCMEDPVNHADPSGHVVVGRELVRSGSYLSDPLGNEIFFAVLGIGLGIATGGASLGLLGAAFGGTTASAAAGLGFAALATEESNPDLSGVLRMFSVAVDFDGTFGSIMAHNIAAKGGRLAAGLGRVSGVRNLPLAGGVQGSINALLKKKGTALGNLYVGGPKSKKLVVTSHGESVIRDRITLPKNMTMEFFTRKGTYLWAGWDGIDKNLKAGAMRPRVGKLDTPDYYLTPVDQDWFRRTAMPAHNLKDIGSYLKRTAVLNDVDILEITGNVKLSQVFDWLQSQSTYHYTHVSGHFCRGALPSTLSQKWLRVGRRLGLHHVWPFTGSPA